MCASLIAVLLTTGKIISRGLNTARKWGEGVFCMQKFTSKIIQYGAYQITHLCKQFFLPSFLLDVVSLVFPLAHVQTE